VYHVNFISQSFIWDRISVVFDEAAVMIIFYEQMREMPYNGTAVEGVCVTGVASRILVLFVSSEAVPVASQYGAIFAMTVREGFCAIAVQVVCLLMIRKFE
jgi:hypothetical protein